MKSILLVEDGKFLRIACERLLTKAGYRVLCAGDGEEALRMAHQVLPDLILLDMMLPRLTGPTVLKQLKFDSDTKNIPVVVLSSLPQSNELRLRGDGATAYFEKSRLDLDQGSEPLLDLVAQVLVGTA